MQYTFQSSIIQSGQRYFIEIPFNVWETTGLKGNIPANIIINHLSFECRLLPKGKGTYWIPVPKAKVPALDQLCDVQFEPIQALTRITHDSPYSREHPIRTIDSIQEIPIEAGLCGHCCIAMLAQVPLSDVVKLLGKAPASWSKIREALDYYGIAYQDQMAYPKKKAVSLPTCCIVRTDDGFHLWYEGRYYGDHFSKSESIISYLSICTPVQTNAELFAVFPYLENEQIIIKQMEETDVDQLSEITSSDAVYRYIPPFLHKRKQRYLQMAINHMKTRDFEKKKWIIAGIYLKKEAHRLVGLVQIFDYKKRSQTATIGYLIHPHYWHQQIATNSTQLLVTYLTQEIKLQQIMAYVMPENIYSAKVLLHNGFVKTDQTRQVHNWGGQETADVDVYCYRTKGEK